MRACDMPECQTPRESGMLYCTRHLTDEVYRHLTTHTCATPSYDKHGECICGAFKGAR
jgi:hypothetical protein